MAIVFVGNGSIGKHYKNFRLFIEDRKFNYCDFNDAYQTLKYCLEFV